VDARQVVLINGPAAVGKSTVGRAVAQTAHNGVCIPGDDVRRMVVTSEPGTVRRSLTYVAGAALADVFLTAGYELVVFEFGFPQPALVERFRRALRSRADVALVTLWAPLAVTLARDRSRPPQDRLGDAAVTASWAELEAHLAEVGPVVDADAPVAQVVDAVLAALAA
jgi:gluconate kinase